MISAQELSEKASLIHKGMEFQVLNHQKTNNLLIRVTSVAIIKKTSCWGDYQKSVVWYETVAQASKRSFVQKKRTDGTTYTQEVWVPNPGVFYTDQSSMSLASFIEYKFNKRLEVQPA